MSCLPIGFLCFIRRASSTNISSVALDNGQTHLQPVVPAVVEPIPYPRPLSFLGKNRRVISTKPVTSANAAITWENTKPFVPPIKSGIVIKVYDGDTITIATRLPMDNSPMYRFSVRLLGIDSAEIKGRTDAEKQLAICARDALASKVFGKVVDLRNISIEKYGRVLADVYLNDLHLNQWMLDNGYAISYDGGTKMRPVEWEK